MDKLLVNIYIPALEKNYDMFIPNFLPIGTVIELIGQMIEEVSDHKYISSGQEFLCFVDKNILLKQNMTLQEYGVRNGEHMLFC